MLPNPQYIVGSRVVNCDGPSATPISGSTLAYAARHRSTEAKGLNALDLYLCHKRLTCPTRIQSAKLAGTSPKTLRLLLQATDEQAAAVRAGRLRLRDPRRQARAPKAPSELIIHAPSLPGHYFQTPCVWECKALNNKNFRAVARDGLERTFPKYSIQLTLYQRFLNKLRCFGTGPIYLKLGRAVRYDTRDLDQWISDRRIASTSETAAKTRSQNAGG